MLFTDDIILINPINKRLSKVELQRNNGLLKLEYQRYLKLTTFFMLDQLLTRN